MFAEFRVVPKKYRYIPNILPKGQDIKEEMVITLNKKEALYCMNYGDVYMIVDGEEVLVDSKGFFNGLDIPEGISDLVPTRSYIDTAVVDEALVL